MGQWQDRKRAGKCTKCGLNSATGKRMILCDSCRVKLKKEHDQERDHSGERG